MQCTYLRGTITIVVRLECNTYCIIILYQNSSILLQLFPFLLSLSSNYIHNSENFSKLLAMYKCHVNTYCDTGDSQNVTVAVLLASLS